MNEVSLGNTIVVLCNMAVMIGSIGDLRTHVLSFKIFSSLHCLLIVLQVMPGLLVGNYQDSKDMAQLEQYGVTHIVAVHDNARKVFKVIY